MLPLSKPMASVERRAVRFSGFLMRPLRDIEAEAEERRAAHASPESESTESPEAEAATTG